jgi:ATPase subunit of ABC transporter with duplicated ATPase domains
LRGGRTGLRALTFENLSLANLTEPFNFEVFFGDRIAVLGKNGTGKSHFLRMIAGDETVKYSGTFKVGARVEIGYFAQTHAHPEFESKSLLEILWETYSLQLGPAKGVLRKYEIDKQAEQKFSSLSGGQQARFQVLLLELSGSTLLLLDEPTDNLDLASAESLEKALLIVTKEPFSQLLTIAGLLVDLPASWSLGQMARSMRAQSRSSTIKGGGWYAWI